MQDVVMFVSGLVGDGYMWLRMSRNCDAEMGKDIKLPRNVAVEDTRR